MSQAFTVDDLLNVNQFTSLCPWDLSPDGELLAVTLSQGKRRVPDDTNYGAVNGAYIVLIDVATGESIEPFSDLQMSWAGRWSPDGQMLAAYVVTQDAPACVGLWNRQTREVFLVSNAVISGWSAVPLWTPDGHRIVVPLIPSDCVSTKSPDIIVQSYTPEQPASNQHGSVFEEPDTDKCVGVVEISSGIVTELTSDLNFTISRMAPDGQAVALLNKIEYPVDKPHFIADVNIVPLDGREPYAVARKVPVNVHACRLSWSPDCQTISYVTGGKWGDPQHLYFTRADGSTEPKMVIEFTSSLGNFQMPWWTRDGTRLIWLQKGCLYHLSIEDGRIRRLLKDSAQMRINAIAQRHGESVLHTDDQGNILAHAIDKRDNLRYIVRIHSVSGEVATVCHAPLSIPDEFTLIASGRSVFARDRQGVQAYPLDRGEATTLLKTNPWQRDVVQPVRQLIEFKDANGRVQKAALFLPRDTRAGDRLPMVVTIYPGSNFSRSDRYASEARLLTSAGYAALYPDSIMKDNNPIEQIVGVTLPAVNRTIEMGFADKNRVGVWGHSYGAYGVMALVTQTRAFRAAVANAPFGINMTSTYVIDVARIGWCEGKQARNGGSLWEKRDAYIENSPLFAFDQVEAPVLVICGTLDVPGSVNARETFLGLRRLGKRVEMREYQREGHVMTNWSAKDTRDYYKSVFNWFNQYLKE